MPATPKNQVDGNNVTELSNLIWRECSDFVNFYRKNKQVLYRGIGRGATAPAFFKSAPRTDRNPLTSTSLMQSMFDSYLKRKGFQALRSNSIFTTSDKNQASAYGDLYVIFPTNGTPFSWSTKQPDVILDDSDLFNPKTVREIALDVRDHDLLRKTVPAFWRKNGASPDGNLNDAAYAISNTNWQSFMYDIAAAGLPCAKHMSLDKLVNGKHIEDMYAMSNQDFGRALMSGHEILVAGPYYGVKLAKAAPLLMNLGISVSAPSSPLDDREPDEFW